jgi:ABC-type amino acid transport substrate-binding protein
LEELEGDEVGVVHGNGLQAALTGAGVPAAQIDDSFSPRALLPALREGKVSACVMGVEQALLARRSDPEVELGVYLGPKHSIALAVRDDAPLLRGALDEYIRNLRRTTTWSRLVLRYFGDSAIEILAAAR